MSAYIISNFVKTKDFRYTEDLKYVILHHTATSGSNSGEAINTAATFYDDHGSPYDIIINSDGKIDLTSRWMQARDSKQYRKNIFTREILNYPRHFIAGIGMDEFQRLYSIHIAVVRNCNNQTVTHFQIISLNRVLNLLKEQLALTDIYFHSELENTSCPGRYFPDKNILIYNPARSGLSTAQTEAQPIVPVVISTGWGFNYANTYGNNL